MSSVDIMTTQTVGTGAALFAALSPTMAAATSRSVEEDEQTDKIIGQADQLYDSNQWKEALAYLEQYAESTNVEVLWRLARLCYKVSGGIRDDEASYIECEIRVDFVYCRDDRELIRLNEVSLAHY